MYDFVCIFYVNGHRTEEDVTARTSIDAKKIIEARYANAKISWISCRRV